MKISFNWLKEHADVGCGANELAGMLPRLGMDADSIARLGPAFTGVVTAEVLSKEKHPAADRLSLCRVSDGLMTYSVVCGAPNVAAGQKVPFAKAGAVLPGGTLSKAKIRGVESEGMICSCKELVLEGDASGIMVLDPSTKAGQDFAALLGGSDSVLDIEITANRPDLLSHLGLARELSVCLGFPMKAAEERPLREDAGLRSFPVEVPSTGECPRYVGRLIEGVAIGESPDWLKTKLKAVGLRPINNVADITNFILMDTGQPLHAFDADLIEGGRIVVRFAKAGEKMTALDGRDYDLTPECLVIADASKPVAIAGVMGGSATAVTTKTKRVFLESANFSPVTVRRCSQLLRLRSDSSYRFERGTDISAAEGASRSAASLIQRLCGKAVAVSPPLDVYPGKKEPSPIRVSADRINAILGSDFPRDEIRRAIEAVSARTQGEGDALTVLAPTWRGDLATPSDLAEEVARILGYDRIPSTVPTSALRPTEELRSCAVAGKARSRLAALGLHEALTYDFISEKHASLLEVPEDRWVRLANPLTEDWTVLRPSLIPGLLQSLRRNIERQAESVRLFELGKVYSRDAAGVRERSHLAGILYGPLAPAHWKASKEKTGLFEAKTILADLLSGVSGLEWTTQARDGGFAGEDLLLPGSRVFIRNASGPKGLSCGCPKGLSFGCPKGLSFGSVLGRLGILHPKLARAWEVDREQPAVFELDLELLAGASSGSKVFRPLSPFPSSWRDLSVVVRQDVPYGEIEAAIMGLKLSELDFVQLVDVYSGKGVADGLRSLSLRFVFQLPDRTLKDAEVTAAVDRILAELKNRFGAELRK
ncbi:MAG: phenylalanine--tRNA ligase subunit beta [Elusimicrobia bacterium]|nr:phenylalanine--tRNA ligase subunit beta [Elusimicrobiota bacterium]